MNKPKIGIYSGSFDPVHLGHITFALQALDEANLDKVYFLPERMPINKQTHEHFGHRVAMIKRAIKPHSKLDLIELEDKTFSVKKTLPKLQTLLKDKDLVFLFGSDKVSNIIKWPNAQLFLESSEMVIGLRQDSSNAKIEETTKVWPKPPLKIISSNKPAIVSTDIRESLQNGQEADGLAKSVAGYIRQNWLYISLKTQVNTNTIDQN